jgi:hypothetical protein
MGHAESSKLSWVQVEAGTVELNFQLAPWGIRVLCVTIKRINIFCFFFSLVFGIKWRRTDEGGAIHDVTKRDGLGRSQTIAVGVSGEEKILNEGKINRHVIEIK